MKTTLTIGYVLVETPLRDDEGVARTIDFPRVGRRLYGSPSLHPVCRPYLAQARAAARAALKNPRRV